MRKILIAILFPVMAYTQDTSKAKLLVVQGRDHRSVIDGYVITVPDGDTCRPIGYLVLNQMRRLYVFRPVPAKYRVREYRFVNKK